MLFVRKILLLLFLFLFFSTALFATDYSIAKGTITVVDGHTTIANGLTVKSSSTLTSLEMSEDLLLSGDFTLEDSATTYDFNVGTLAFPNDQTSFFSSSIMTFNAGVQNDRSFLAIYGDLLKGVELGYLENESDFLGLRFNLFNNGDLEIIDDINLKGLIYAADYSANFVTRSLIDKGYVDSNFLNLTGGTITGYTTISSTLTVESLDVQSNDGLSGLVTAYSAARNGTTTLETLSFGNGEQGEGVVMPQDGTVIALGVSASTASSGDLTLYINAVDSGTSLSLSSETSGYDIVSVDFNQGDRLYLRVDSGSLDTPVGCFLVKFN